MTSRDKRSDEAYVWIWLPGETDPVVAGRLYTEGDTLDLTDSFFTSFL
ncbi:MAG: hypothetical protein OXF19_02910 [Hyphomicrobiales bacterium]|nr:hypothetical protein [Hyphomicrobiales bacterium]